MAYLSSLIYVISRKLQKFGQFLSRALPTYYDYKDEDEYEDAYHIDDFDDGTFIRLVKMISQSNILQVWISSANFEEQSFAMLNIKHHFKFR